MTQVIDLFFQNNIIH